MCGICGIYNYRYRLSADETLLRSMVTQIIHRGPDDDGFYVSGAVGLGMRRLSIIDLEGGHQPMCNEDGSIWIVFNGEIYNFPELRRELQAKGHIFRTRSDTETVVHAYEEWGLAAFSKLNGMFGFALWDSRRQELILARDPFGIKPLYYTDTNGRLLFASEIKAILADPTVQKYVDEQALDEFLTLTFVPSPRTLFAGIQKIPPGYVVRVTPAGPFVERFYTLIPGQQFRSEAEWLEALRTTLEAAVQRQMVADVPVGMMLSGGVDSAAVAMLMQRLAGQPIHTFTVGFSGQFNQNELVAARRSAELIGSQHHEAVISADEYAEFLPRSLWYLEEPIATTSALAFYWICRLARQHVKVVLTGQGADEPFAGYGRHFGEYYGGWYRKLPAFVQDKIITAFVDCLPRNEQLKRAVHSLGIQNPLERLTQIYSIFDTGMKRRLYLPGFADLAKYSIRESIRLWQQDVQNLDGLSQILYVDARFSLPDNLLLYGDKMSMAASLEARVPFLDLELMALVEGIPPHLKIHGRTQKYLLKRAVTAWVPQEIIQRKKIGFATPVDQWFGGKLRSYVGEHLLASNSACRHYFEPLTIKRLISDHESKRHDHKRQLFSLLTFELWYKQFMS
jgi:asparagine synthase (glutamine-hydrolysing)